MKAMVLAAGVGSRLDPLTRKCAKPMVPVFNRPCVDHILDLLRDNGYDEILLNLHYFADQVAAHLAGERDDGLRLRLEHEDQLWGDAGSLKRYADFFDDTLLVIGGDDLCDFDLGQLLEFHRERGGLGTIALYKVDDPSQYGVARVDGVGQVLEFAEKPAPDEATPFRTNEGAFLANTGIYIFEPAVLDLIPAGVEYLLGRQVLPALREAGELFALPLPGYWKDVGALTAYRQANRDCLDGLVRATAPAPEVEPGVFQSASAEVDAGATIITPVAIGPECVIEAGARVGPGTLLGRGCRVGTGATVTESILWDNVRMEPGAYVQDCVIVNDARVSGETAVFGGAIIPAAAVTSSG